MLSEATETVPAVFETFKTAVFLDAGTTATLERHSKTTLANRARCPTTERTVRITRTFDNLKSYDIRNAANSVREPSTLPVFFSRFSRYFDRRGSRPGRVTVTRPS